MDIPLQPGCALELAIAPDDVHEFRVDLQRAAVADVRIHQGPVDLTVEVQGPDGKRSAEIDGYEYGPEVVCWEAAAGGTYRLIIRTKSQSLPGATYRIGFSVLPGVTPAASLCMQASQWATEARRLSSSRAGDALHQAVRLHQSALQIWEQLGETASQAAALVSIGLVQFGLGDLREAEIRFRLALGLFCRLEDSYGQAAMLNDLGLVLCQLGQPEAFDVLTQAVDAWSRLGIGKHTAAALNNLAMLHSETGEWNAALRHYAEASKHGKAGAGSLEAEAYIAHNVGVIFLSLGECKKADENLDTAARLFAQMDAPQQQARALLRLGQTHLLARHWPEALDLADRATALVQSRPDARLEGDLLRLYGEIAAQAGQPRDAGNLCLRSADSYRKAGSLSGEAEALHQAALACRSAGSAAAAMENLKQALHIRRAAGLRDGQAATLHAMATIEAESGRLSEALELAGQAVSIIEELRTRVLGPELRSSYFSSRQHYCGLLIRVLMELDAGSPGAGFSKQAFNASERARARSLLELLSESNREIRSGVDPNLIEEERRIGRRIILLSRRLSEKSESASQEVEKLQAERQQIEERIRASSVVYASLLRPEPFDLQAVQAAVLDEDTALLQFALGDPCSYVWIVSRRDFRSFRIAPRVRIEEAARRAHELLRLRPRRTGSPNHAIETDQLLSELSELLIEPISGSLCTKRLLIAAEGWLQYVPFGALRKPGSPAPLSAQHEIVYASSASTIGALREKRARGQRCHTRRLLAVADPVYELAGASRAEEMPYMRPIPFSRIEANGIRDLVPPGEATVALGFDANRELLTDNDLTPYRIIHFGAHAFIDDKYPELCSIALSRFRKDGTVTDGLFRLPEIYNLDLDAELVVLAACSSGLGKEVRGEGFVGMVRAFMYAGAAKILATLWEIDDQATARFMHHFYTSLLRDNAHPAEAVTIAQTRLAAEPRWNLPHFWAGFVLFGDWREINH